MIVAASAMLKLLNLVFFAVVPRAEAGGLIGCYLCFNSCFCLNCFFLGTFKKYEKVIFFSFFTWPSTDSRLLA